MHNTRSQFCYSDPCLPDQHHTSDVAINRLGRLNEEKKQQYLYSGNESGSTLASGERVGLCVSHLGNLTLARLHCKFQVADTVSLVYSAVNTHTRNS